VRLVAAEPLAGTQRDVRLTDKVLCGIGIVRKMADPDARSDPRLGAFAERDRLR
jgi:hypothetical protein